MRICTYHEGAHGISKRGNRHLRKIIWLMTISVIQHNPILRNYFLKRRNEGDPFKKVVFATAHMLMRGIFAVLSKKTSFVDLMKNSRFLYIFHMSFKIFLYRFYSFIFKLGRTLSYPYREVVEFLYISSQPFFVCKKKRKSKSHIRKTCKFFDA
jgi:hypothetical protein